MPNLKDSTVLVRLGITSWPGKRHDPKIDEQVRIANSAHGDIGRFNKVLLAPQRLKEIAAVVNAFRSIHYHLTAPWLDEGLRILPAKLYTEHQTEERKFRLDFENKVAAFVADYPQLKADAKAAMNGLFNESDYPDIGTVAARFTWSVRYYPVAEAGDDWRLDLDDEHMTELREEARRLESVALAQTTKNVQVLPIQLLFVGHPRSLFTARGLATHDLSAVERRRKIRHHRIEQLLNALVLERRSA